MTRRQQLQDQSDYLDATIGAVPGHLKEELHRATASVGAVGTRLAQQTAADAMSSATAAMETAATLDAAAKDLLAKAKAGRIRADEMRRDVAGLLSQLAALHAVEDRFEHDLRRVEEINDDPATWADQNIIAKYPALEGNSTNEEA